MVGEGLTVLRGVSFKIEVGGIAWPLLAPSGLQESPPSLLTISRMYEPNERTDFFIDGRAIDFLDDNDWSCLRTRHFVSGDKT